MERSHRSMFACIIILLILVLSGCDGKISQCIDLDGIENEEMLQNIHSVEDIAKLKSKAANIEESYFIVGATGGLYEGRARLMYDTCTNDESGIEESSSAGEYVIEYYCKNKLSVGRTVVKCDNGCHSRACLSDLHCQVWVDAALNSSKDSNERIMNIQTLRFRDCPEYANQLIPLLTETEEGILRTTLITLSRHQVQEASDEILELFYTTENEYVFASASVALFDLVNEQEDSESCKRECDYIMRENAFITQKELLQIYADETVNMFGGQKYFSMSLNNYSWGPRHEFESYIRVNIQRNKGLILKLLEQPNDEYFIAALQYAPLVYSDDEGARNEAVDYLTTLLDTQNENEYNKKILIALIGMQLSNEQAQEIINNISYAEYYSDEWNYIDSITRQILLKIETSNIPTEEQK